MAVKFDTDMTKPFTSEELDVLGLDCTNNNILVAFNVGELSKEDLNALEMSVLPICGGPPPKLANLLYASSFMYQQIGRTFRILEGMVSTCEALSAQAAARGERDRTAEGFYKALTDIQDRLLEARRCAVVGPVALAAEIHAERLTQTKKKG